MKAIHKARSELLSGRKLQFDDTDISDLGINIDEVLPMLAPMICLMMDESKDDFVDEMAVEGLVCSEFGCDDAEIPNLIMSCNMDGEVCEVDDNNEEFCVKDTSVETSFSLNFAGKAPISSTQCSTYTRPDYMADMGPGCWKVDVAMDMGAMMDEAMSGELEDSSMMTDFEITECSSSFYDGTTCDCGFCDEGMGFELTCSNNLVSEECTDVDSSATDIFSMAGQDGQGGEAWSPSSPISVLRLASITESDAGVTRHVSDDAFNITEA